MWVARFSSHRLASLALAVAVVLLDGVLLSASHSFTFRALLDEPSHLATAVIVLGTITRWRGRPPGQPFIWAMLLSSVVIDLDHLPAELAGGSVLYGSLPRPYTHALWLLALLAVAAVAAGRRARVSSRAAAAAAVFAGAAWGVAAHFLRDLVTAPIALWWPLSSAWLRLPYGWYAAALVLAAVLPLPRKGHA